MVLEVTVLLMVFLFGFQILTMLITIIRTRENEKTRTMNQVDEQSKTLIN